METNPLRQYFRQPAIYIRLPSNGDFYPDGALQRTADGEYPILPMTTMDEITYRTPDALFNGTATVTVIQSCMPNIRDAWQIPSCDVDTILTAIRIASYGHGMEISSACPECQEESSYDLDLRSVLSQLSAADYSKPMQIGDLEIHFRPMTYRDMTDSNITQFQEQKILQQVMDPDNNTDEQRLASIAEALRKLTAFTIHAIASNIDMIVAPGAQVTDPAHIEEWLTNCERRVYEQVRDRAVAMKNASEIQPLKMTCAACNKSYEQTYTLDLANFFAAAS